MLQDIINSRIKITSFKVGETVHSTIIDKSYSINDLDQDLIITPNFHAINTSIESHFEKLIGKGKIKTNFRIVRNSTFPADNLVVAILKKKP